MIASVGRMMRKGGGGHSWPAALKESLVCWYSPRKQKLTEYDVIESYDQDFTYWTLDNTGITSTPKKIVIPTGTELKYVIAFRGFNSFTAGFDIKYTGNAVITYRYNKEDGTVGTIAINESGIYHLPASVRTQKNFGFYCNPQTVTEEATIEQLPTSILKDFSGNGLDAYMYGFQGKLNSGMGVYNNDFTDSGRGNFTWVYTTGDITVNGADSFTVHNNREKWVFRCTTNVKPMTVKIVGVSNDINFKYRYESENGEKWIFFKKDGIYELPATIGTWQGFNLEKNNDIDVNITVTQIPDYPNQLCYSGKEYCVSYNQPILTDYTVIADRTWFDKQINHNFANNTYLDDAVNRGFLFEQIKSDTEVWATSFGTNNAVQMAPDGILYQTKNSYNGTPINSGNAAYIDKIVIGCYLNKQQANPNYFYHGCHSDFLLFNRTLTQEEIDWVKNNCFVIDIPTPTYNFDFSKLKSGQDTFVDKYGNELSLYNFQWAGMSGKGGYPIDLKATFPRNYTDGRDYICNDKEITCSYIGNSGLFQVLETKQDVTKYIEIPEFTIKITGSENIKLIYFYIKEDFTKGIFNIIGNGIYKIPKSYKANKIVEGINWLGFVLQKHINKNVDFKLEILPLYPNALVFDGIDDYASFQKTSKLIKSVIVDFIPLKHENNHGIIYDQRLLGNGDVFAIYHAENLPAYSARNNGDTYIDGVLNTTLIPEQLTGKHMQVAITNNNILEMNGVIFIGCRATIPSAPFYSAMALYRITGFTEVLTPDQIWKWYQKNQPKGGDK